MNTNGGDKLQDIWLIILNLKFVSDHQSGLWELSVSECRAQLFSKEYGKTFCGTKHKLLIVDSSWCSLQSSKKCMRFGQRPAAVERSTLLPVSIPLRGGVFTFWKWEEQFVVPWPMAIIVALCSHRDDCARRGGCSWSAESWCQWDDSLLSVFGPLWQRPSLCQIWIKRVKTKDLGPSSACGFLVADQPACWFLAQDSRRHSRS